MRGETALIWPLTLQSTKAFKDMEIPDGRINIADITEGATKELDEAFKGISALIICTSATPKMVTPPKVTPSFPGAVPPPPLCSYWCACLVCLRSDQHKS